MATIASHSSHLKNWRYQMNSHMRICIGVHFAPFAAESTKSIHQRWMHPFSSKGSRPDTDASGPSPFSLFKGVEYWGACSRLKLMQVFSLKMQVFSLKMKSKAGNLYQITAFFLFPAIQAIFQILMGPKLAVGIWSGSKQPHMQHFGRALLLLFSQSAVSRIQYAGLI